MLRRSDIWQGTPQSICSDGCTMDCVKKSEAVFGILRIPVDAAAVAAALLLAYWLRTQSIDLLPRVQLLDPPMTIPPLDVYIATFVWPGILGFLLVAALLSLYALQSTYGAWRETGRIIIAALLWLVGVMAWYFLVRKELFYSRILLLHSTVFIALFVTLGRGVVTVLQRACMRMGMGVRSVVALGTHPVSPPALAALARDPRYRYLGQRTDVRDLQELLASQPVDLVLQTDPDPKSSATLELIEACRSRHIGYAFLPPVLGDVPHQLSVERLGLVPMIRFQPTPLDGWGRIFKRIFDMVLSALLLVLLTPLFLIIALLIILDSGWPVFYVSPRMGERGMRRIPVLKFRSMIQHADRLKDGLAGRNERADGPLFKVRGDPRITRVGRWLRRFDLDELPQLLNVFIGQMSLVGPRPHLPEEVDRYTQYQRRVFAVKPGMTGLAQISGRSSLPFEEEVRLDLRYIEEWSVLMDLWILWRTVFVVLSGHERG